MKYGNNYWEVFSSKIKRIVKFYSDLEYDNWVLIESDLEVKDFCEQPLKINYVYNGKKEESIFDMWVRYNDGKEIFLEIKYSSELDSKNPKSKRAIKQTKVQRLWSEENGFNYEIRTEKEIRSNIVYLNNLKSIISYTKTRSYYNEKDVALVLKTIGTEKHKIVDILNEISSLSNQQSLQTLYGLVYEGKVKSNINEKVLDYETEVWVDA